MFFFLIYIAKMATRGKGSNKDVIRHTLTIVRDIVSIFPNSNTATMRLKIESYRNGSLDHTLYLQKLKEWVRMTAENFDIVSQELNNFLKVGDVRGLRIICDYFVYYRIAVEIYPLGELVQKLKTYRQDIDKRSQTQTQKTSYPACHKDVAKSIQMILNILHAFIRNNYYTNDSIIADVRTLPNMNVLFPVHNRTPKTTQRQKIVSEEGGGGKASASQVRVARPHKQQRGLDPYHTSFLHLLGNEPIASPPMKRTKGHVLQGGGGKQDVRNVLSSPRPKAQQGVARPSFSGPVNMLNDLLMNPPAPPAPATRSSSSSSYNAYSVRHTPEIIHSDVQYLLSMTPSPRKQKKQKQAKEEGKK